MATLQVRGPDLSVTKQKAIEDAQKMQALVEEECAKRSIDPPAYALIELIGKGSFGRVYKATDKKNKALVAVKIIDIEESDTLNPKLADTYREILNEINALKLLSNSGARNINHVIDALPVLHNMWMITEYCAGGSVATLMKPTAPGGLQEKWIIPILREVAEAIFWVHREGIIHRDVKCANVLITEAGDVQLCDFGVAGVIETKFDKRSTFIGTPNWMAPELFDPSAKYGTEVDIWAFGSLVFEIASGLPPNAHSGLDVRGLGNYLKQHAPRLIGDQYSAGLRDLVAYCMEEDPQSRPTIEDVQQHQYIFNTTSQYPTSSLGMLVRGYKLWEAQGGSRKSLFSFGGAQGPLDLASTALDNDEWNFSSTAAFDRQVLENNDTQAVFDAYGSSIDFQADFPGASPRPSKLKGRRRPPPQQLAAFKAPLEKIFDPHTLSNYTDNSKAYYGQPMPPPTSDLPLRNEYEGGDDTRLSLIDLDAVHDPEDPGSNDMDTIKAGGRGSIDLDAASDINKPPLSDPELKGDRRTKDWKFPTMPPASANPELSRFPFNDDRSGSTPGSARPQLVHHTTEPVPSQGYERDLLVPRANPAANRASSGSLIDLDMSLPALSMEQTRPSTANSETASISGSDVGHMNPFEFEGHASMYIPTSNREPSIYVSDDSEFASRLPKDEDMPPPNARRQPGPGYGADQPYSSTDYSDTEFSTPQPTTTGTQRPLARPGNGSRGPGVARGIPGLPPLPPPPSERVMQGLGSTDEVKAELKRMLESLGQHLNHTGEVLAALPVRRARARPSSGDSLEEQLLS